MDSNPSPEVPAGDSKHAQPLSTLDSGAAGQHPPETLSQAALHHIWRLPQSLQIGVIVVGVVAVGTFLLLTQIPEDIKTQVLRPVIAPTDQKPSLPIAPSSRSGQLDSGMTDIDNSQPKTASTTTPSPEIPLTALGSRAKPLAISPQRLTEFYNDERNTSIQADALFATYRGKWMLISGVVVNVSRGSHDNAAAYLRSDYADRALIDVVARVVSADQIEAVALLRRGDRVKMVGQIDEASMDVITLANCELVDE